MNLRVIIDYDKETGLYSSVCPELPGCASSGKTEQEAMDNIKEAIALYLEPDRKPVSSSARVIKVSV